jgi:hypothetical protein
MELEDAAAASGSTPLLPYLGSAPTRVAGRRPRARPYDGHGGCLHHPPECSRPTKEREGSSSNEPPLLCPPRLSCASQPGLPLAAHRAMLTITSIDTLPKDHCRKAGARHHRVPPPTPLLAPQRGRLERQPALHFLLRAEPEAADRLSGIVPPADGDLVARLSAVSARHSGQVPRQPCRAGCRARS